MTTTRLEFAPDRYPTGPGVYLFKDSRGRVLYVGKAKNLRKRLGSYFRSAAHLPLKTRLLVQGSATIDVLRTESEKEALLLEAGLIKKHRPRYNVVLRDDKEYLLFKLDKRAAYPRLTITRKVVQDGSVYFGPFASAQAARETLKILNRLFPLRKCRDATFRNRSRPCLQHDIHRCLAPCVFPVAPQEYNRLVEQVELFLAGHSARLLRALSADMKAASAKLEFERAARLRDQIQAVKKTVEQQAVVFHDTRDRDVLGLHRSEEGTALGVAFIRQGRLLDQKNYFFEPGPGSGQAGEPGRRPGADVSAGSDHEADRETVSAFLMQFYWYGRYVPDTILLPFAMDTSLLEEVVGERAGHKVRIRAARGRREKGLVCIATANAREGLLRREELRGPGGTSLARALNLPEEPDRIEVVDVSHLSGQGTVVGQVVFEDGLPRKEEYRVYRMEAVDGTFDDYQALSSWAGRRLKSGPPWPDLVLIDGGKGQLAAVDRMLRDRGVPEQEGAWNLAAIAKGSRRAGELEERVFLPGRKNPLPLKPGSRELLFLQHLRDVAHRFVLSRQRRSRKSSVSQGELERLPGIGPATARMLRERFGTLAAITAATEQELRQLPGVGAKRAEQIRQALAQRTEDRGQKTEG
ncbi:MAG: excinuclease ABC subunit UvrC [Desulfovibrionales bacterium]